MAEPQTGMPKADLRRMVNAARKEPVNCAIGLGPDAAFGLLMMDKIKQPKALEKLLMTTVPDAKNTRWGTAAVNPDEDPKLLRLTMNRAASGMARRLIKTLKGSGINKLEIVLDDGTLVERYAEEDEEEGQEGQGTAPADQTEPVPPAGPGHSELQHRLAGLIPRVQQLGAAHPQQRELAQLAAQANTALKGEDLKTAETAITELATKLDGASASSGGGEGAVVRVAKGLLVWNSTRGYVDQQVKKLAKAIVEQSAGEADFEEIKANLGKIDAVLEKLDDRLSDKLNELRGTTDPAEKTKITAQARQVVSDYQTYVATDPMMADIDDNGFIPLDVTVKVKAALDAVLKTI